MYNVQGIIVIDSLSVGLKPQFLKNEDDLAVYPVYYLGPRKDSIHLGLNPLPRYKSPSDSTSLIPPSISYCSIFVDTSFKSYHQVKYRDEKENLVVERIKSYGILIENKSQDTMNIGAFGCVTILEKQAKNNYGEWTKIDQPFETCETYANQTILPPNEILIAKSLRQSGGVLAECRLVAFGQKDTIFSNVFLDRILSKRFEELSIPDE